VNLEKTKLYDGFGKGSRSAEVLKLSNAPTALSDDDFSVAARIIRHNITHLQCTPSMARLIAMNDEAVMAIGRIKHLMLGGEALARWKTKDAWMQYYGLRAAEIAQIWTGVYGVQAYRRLVNVIATQTGWKGLEKQALEAPMMGTANPPPVAYFDAYAVAGYFGRVLGTDDRAPLVRTWIETSRAEAARRAADMGRTGQARTDYIATHQYDTATALAGQDLINGAISGDVSDTLADLLGTVLPYHAAVASTHNLDLVMYEGGSHVVGVGLIGDVSDLTAFYTHLNYSDEMGALYQRLIAQKYPELIRNDDKNAVDGLIARFFSQIPLAFACMRSSVLQSKRCFCDPKNAGHTGAKA